VIHLVNDEFVPVWIDVRTTAIPDLPALGRLVTGLKLGLDEDRRVCENRRGFLLVSAITTSDGAILLNPEPTDDPLGMLFEKGHFPYSRVKPDEYLAMLRRALSYIDR